MKNDSAYGTVSRRSFFRRAPTTTSQTTCLLHSGDTLAERRPSRAVARRTSSRRSRRCVSGLLAIASVPAWPRKTGRTKLVRRNRVRGCQRCSFLVDVNYTTRTVRRPLYALLVSSLPVGMRRRAAADGNDLDSVDHRPSVARTRRRTDHPSARTGSSWFSARALLDVDRAARTTVRPCSWLFTASRRIAAAAASAAASATKGADRRVRRRFVQPLRSTHLAQQAKKKPPSSHEVSTAPKYAN